MLKAWYCTSLFVLLFGCYACICGSVEKVLCILLPFLIAFPWLNYCSDTEAAFTHLPKY